MIFRLLAGFAGLLLLFPAEARAQSLVWARQVAGSNSQEGRAMALDAAGNVYVTGHLWGNADFDPGPGVLNLTSSGPEDVFVMKLDVNGDLVWAKLLGAHEAYSLALDTAGNVYTTGFFTSGDFDPGPGTYNMTGAGQEEVFISKLDNNGDFAWAKKIGSTGEDIGYGVTVGSSGDIFVAGAFEGVVDFDPGTGVSNLTSAGAKDIFILKLNSAGNFVYAKRMGGSNDDIVQGLAVDQPGNVYTAGYFSGTADFDPGTGTLNITSAGFLDGFISKLNASGNLVFGKAIQGPYWDACFAISLDPWANILVGGYFEGTVDFDPGPGTYFCNSVIGSYDAFAAKYSSSGNIIWAKDFGDFSQEITRALTVDSAGSVYVTGDFCDTVDFDPGPGVHELHSEGPANDEFICKLDSGGNFRWAKDIGGSFNELAHEICVDMYRNVHLCGVFNGVSDLEPDTGVVNFTSAGAGDLFALKMNPCQDVIPLVLNVSSCDSFFYNSVMYTSSGSYEHAFVTARGCDSTVTLNLTILHASAAADSITACDSLTWIDGNTYTSSTGGITYNYAGGAANGCDSLVTLHLTINSSAGSTDVQTACDSLTWIDGNTYTSSNSTATYTFVNPGGCDSIVTLDLTITAVDDSVTQNGNTLTSGQAGATYQWVDCGNDQPVPGATGQSFTPTIAGHYAVIVTVNGCQDTSACMDMTTLGAPGAFSHGRLRHFPNPADEQLNIVFSLQQSTTFRVTLEDVYGRNVTRLDYDLHSGTSTVTIDLEQLPAGVYLLGISDGARTETSKLIIR